MLKLFLIFLLLTSSALANQWRAGTGEQTLDGTSAAALIGTNSFNSIVQPLDNLLATFCNQYLIYNSGSSINVSAGSVMVSNSGGTVRLMLKNSAATTLTSANLDSGSLTASTTYYVYAIAASNSVSTATYSISASSTAPSGQTYYYQIGSFFYSSSSAIENIKNNYYAPPSSPTSNGTFSSGVVYQNNTANKAIVVWNGACSAVSGGWAGLNQIGYIGESSSPATQVAAWSLDISGSSNCQNVTGTFVVPAGWYWEITNGASSGGSGGRTGSISRIETWNLN